MSVRSEWLRTDDGLDIALHRIGPSRGTPVLCVHGTFSNHSYWIGTRGSGFARALALHGFEAWVIDLRGHGASPQPRRGQYWDFEDWARFDVSCGLTAAVRAAEERDTRALAIGHSAGGAALLTALAGEPELPERIAGLVLAATPLPWTQGFRRAGVHGIRLMTRVLPRFPARRLGLGPEDELNGVMRQWMGWNLRRRMSGRDGIDYLDSLDRLRMPALALAGSHDRVFAPPASCRQMLERLGSADRQFILAGVESGFDSDYGHPDLIASRTARHEIWPLLIEWLERHAPVDQDNARDENRPRTLAEGGA